MYTVLYQRDAIDDGVANPRGTQVFIANLVLCLISALFVGARWYVRIVMNGRIESDDWMILSAVPISFTMTALFHEEAKNGFGLPIRTISQDHIIQAFKYFYACQILYKIGVACTKTSLLLLYNHVFMGRKFQIGVWITIFVVVASAVSTSLATVFQCTPIAKAWDASMPGHCIYVGGVWYASSAIAILTDVMIIALPISQLPALKLPRGQKIALAFLFSLGAFIIMTTVVRIATLGPAVTAADSTWYQSENNLWLGIEVNTSIICACLPPLRKLIVAFLPRLFGSSSNGSGRHGGGLQSHTQTYPNPIHTVGSYAVRSHVKARTVHDPKSPTNDSDEEFMLDTMGQPGITKTTEMAISYRSVDSELDGKRNAHRNSGTGRSQDSTMDIMSKV